MLMDAILDQFWPEHGHNFSAGVNLQLRPNNNKEIVQIDLGIYMQPLQRMPRRPAHGGRAGGRAGGREGGTCTTKLYYAWRVAAATL